MDAQAEVHALEAQAAALRLQLEDPELYAEALEAKVVQR